MKLQELAVNKPTEQAAKVLESYFGNRVDFDTLTKSQARGMLKKIRSLVSEHRRTREFHSSEKNPAYLKLVVLEQALSARVMEEVPVASIGAMPADSAALQSAQAGQKKRQDQDQIKQIDQQIAALTKQKSQIQQQMNNPLMTSESRKLRQRLKESEIQQAQVVLASQDMVDQVQKMLEQVSSMQFKDLPALVDQVKDQIGVDQAMQFNTDANAALTGMIQNLQGSKQQLEQALGVVTGQAPTVPGEDLGAEPDADMSVPDAEMGPPEADMDAELDTNLEPADSTLGRGRRK